MQSATITVEQAAKALGISRNAAYAGVKANEIPSIRIGRRVLVPKIAFERMLAEAGRKPRQAEAA
jgi:excisionase family DNA binding protein